MSQNLSDNVAVGMRQPACARKTWHFKWQLWPKTVTGKCQLGAPDPGETRSPMSETAAKMAASGKGRTLPLHACFLS
ncbi:hypothetical protein [Brachymonas denitrificans]|uniref:hypothetical protein n=1 Tax=Brachymonas denitrificans TaxID=28220 RepID=UPI001356411A|nr:hypothetical protein [Brachymonas denitrificans]